MLDCLANIFENAFLRKNKMWYPDKKENQIFLIYKEIQSGAVAKSFIRKGFLMYEEIRKYFPIYEEAVSHIWLCNCSILNFLRHEENFILFFISVPAYLLDIPQFPASSPDNPPHPFHSQHIQSYQHINISKMFL